MLWPLEEMQSRNEWTDLDYLKSTKITHTYLLQKVVLDSTFVKPTFFMIKKENGGQYWP